MFGALIKALTAETEDQLPEPDARLALGALLVRVGRADGHYDAEEAGQVETILARRYAISASDAKALRMQAETLETEAPDTVRFTRAIKEHVAYEDRAGVMEDLWELALADGERSNDESSLMRLVAPMIGINDRDSALARQRVEARLGG